MNETVRKQLKQARKFLATIPAEDFIANRQTENFNKEFIGKKHCVYGHLFVNPASPFYSAEKAAVQIRRVNKLEFIGLETAVTEGYYNRDSLVRLNNISSDKDRKSNILKRIDEMLETV